MQVDAWNSGVVQRIYSSVTNGLGAKPRSSLPLTLRQEIGLDKAYAWTETLFLLVRMVKTMQAQQIQTAIPPLIAELLTFFADLAENLPDLAFLPGHCCTSVSSRQWYCPRMRLIFPVCLCAALFLSACGDDSGGPGGTGGAAGTPGGLGFEAGEARAGVLSAEQLPIDSTGLAVYSAGDFFLANEYVGIVVEDAIDGQPIDSDLYTPFGGNIIGVSGVDVDGPDGAAFADAADYNEVTIGLSRFLARAESIEVQNDGTDGNPAVVRLTGKLNALPFLEDVLVKDGDLSVAGGLFLPPADSGDETFLATNITVDYELAPQARYVDVFYTTDVSLMATPIYLMIQSKRMAPYVPGEGFGSGTTTSVYEYMAFAASDSFGYAVENPLGPMAAAVPSLLGDDPEISGVLPLKSMAQVEFASGVRQHLMRLHIGGLGIEGLRAAIAETNGEVTRTINGVVSDVDDTPVAGVRVHATLDDADPTDTEDEPTYLTRTQTNENGEYQLSVPAEDVLVAAYKRGEGIPDAVAIPADQSTGDIALPGSGTLSISATELGKTGGLPVRVQVIDENNAYRPPSAWGEQVVPNEPMADRVQVVFPTDGVANLKVPADTDFRIVVSRGYEYSIYNQIHSVEEDTNEDIPAVLERVVDSTGVMCADFHIHTTRSPDSPDSGEFKVASAVGDGIELPVRTDHEFVGTFEPEVAKLGLEPWALGLSSLELTTFTWGHFGVFPFEADPTMINGGATSWYRIDPSTGEIVIDKPVEVFERARGTQGERAIIVFHPRTPPRNPANLSFGAVAGSSYFEGGSGFSNAGGVGLDPATGVVEGNGKFDVMNAAELAEWWDEDFTTMETFNDRSFEENRLNPARPGALATQYGTVDDWFNFLQNDRPMFSVGSSDSHSVMGGSPVGYPRTCIAVGSDDPAGLRALSGTPETLRDLVTSGESVINGGFYLTATATGGVGPGGRIEVPSGSETVSLVVQAPGWVGPVDRVEMWWGDGTTVSSEIYVDEGILGGLGGTLDQLEVIRFTADVSIPVTAKWVVFHARGEFDPTLIDEDGDPDRSLHTQTLAPIHPDRLPFGVTNPIFYTRP